VQNFKPVPPPPPLPPAPSAPPPPPPPPAPLARLFKPREIQLGKEVDQQTKGDIPPFEQGGNPFRKKAKGKCRD